MSYTDEELESILSNYTYFIKELRDTRVNILFPYVLTDTNTGGSSSGRISNPTESTAIALSEPDDEELKVKVRAIQNTYSKMSIDFKKMMEFYYFERPYGMKDESIAARLNVDRATLWRWRKKVCKEVAKQLDI